MSDLILATISEADLPGTLLFRARLTANQSWEVRYDPARSGLPGVLTPFFQQAVRFDPPDGNNTLRCSHQADSNGTSFCDLRLVTTVDVERIKRTYHASPVGPRKRFFEAAYRCHCRKPADVADSGNPPTLEHYRFKLFLGVTTLNEFPPQFTRPLVTVTSTRRTWSGEPRSSTWPGPPRTRMREWTDRSAASPWSTTLT